MTEEITSSQWTASITKLNNLSKYNNRSFCYLFLSQCDDDSSVHSQVSVFGSELLAGCRLCALMHSICHNKLSLTAYHVWKILLLSEVCFKLWAKQVVISAYDFLSALSYFHSRPYAYIYTVSLFCPLRTDVFYITIVGLTSGFLCPLAVLKM